VLQLEYRSLRHRRLVFRPEKAQHAQVNGSSMNKLLSGPNLVARLAGSRRERYKRILDPLNLGWKALFSRHGLFGVESPHFLTMFVLREAVELSLQTYQAYRSSHLLPRVWLNNMLVAMLVMSCWCPSLPAPEASTRKSRGSSCRRLHWHHDAGYSAFHYHDALYFSIRHYNLPLRAFRVAVRPNLHSDFRARGPVHIRLNHCRLRGKTHPPLGDLLDSGEHQWAGIE